MHMGVIKASNLCTEIVQFSSPTETAVCILGAVCLPRFVHADGSFDFVELHRVSKAVVRDLDKLIDIAQFPTADAAVSAYDTRSIGLGTQGLADVFASLGLPFTSPQAKALNIQIFETICHAALDSSCELAERFGPYDRWTGSAAASGVLHVDMWGQRLAVATISMLSGLESSNSGSGTRCSPPKCLPRQPPSYSGVLKG